MLKPRTISTPMARGSPTAKSGGADAALFDLDAASGVLSFVGVPDFEAPGDANGDNDYEVQVTVADTSGLTDVRTLPFPSPTSPINRRSSKSPPPTTSAMISTGSERCRWRTSAAWTTCRCARPWRSRNKIHSGRTPSPSPRVRAKPSRAASTIRLSQPLGELVIASDVTIDGDLDDDGAPDVTVTGDTLGDDPTTTDPLGNAISRPRGDNSTTWPITSVYSTSSAARPASTD